jgi:hypothetical protein
VEKCTTGIVTFAISPRMFRTELPRICAIMYSYAIDHRILSNPLVQRPQPML